MGNFVLLCSNCHTLTHFYSSSRFQNKEIGSYLKAELENDAINRLHDLTLKVHDARMEIKENGNLWVVSKPYTIKETIDKISIRNKFDDNQRCLLSEVIDVVLKKMPSVILNECSFRLLKEGRYLSINLMNYLLFRTPAYGDFAEKPQFECFLTFPKDQIPYNLKPIESRDLFFFKHFDCVNIGLSYVEALKLNENDWNLFEDACRMAQNARKTRNWVSNVTINSID